MPLGDNYDCMWCAMNTRFRLPATALLCGSMLFIGCMASEQQSQGAPLAAKQSIVKFGNALQRNDQAALHVQLCNSMVRTSVSSSMEDLGPEGRENLSKVVFRATFAPTLSSASASVFLLDLPNKDPADPVRVVVHLNGDRADCLELLP